MDDYYVFNRQQRSWYKGMAVNSKSKDRFFVSFKTKKTVKPFINDNILALKVYPNPARNSITIEYITTGIENTAIEIFNITGKKMVNRSKRQSAGLHQSIVNTRNFKNGIYLLRLTSGEYSEVQRFVINR